MTRGGGKCSNAAMNGCLDWRPFRVCAAGEKPPRPRGLGTPQGLGDRLRVAAFAERQARDAFLWAAQRFSEVSAALRAEWRRMGAEEGRHLGMILRRMEELGVDPAERPVSDALWRGLSSCRDARTFSAWMREAEERGKAAEESFAASLKERDPITAAMFAEIAADEAEHLAIPVRHSF